MSLISKREVNFFSSLALYKFSITDFVSPETYFKILLEAVLMFTPTSFTTLEVVKSKASVNSF